MTENEHDSKDKCPAGGWTFPTLEKYLDAKITELHRKVARQEEFNKERFASREDALVIAREVAATTLTSLVEQGKMRYEGIERRLEETIRQRILLGETVTKLIPRNEAEKAHSELTQQLQQLREHSITADVYQVQHEQLKEQVSDNTKRLYDIEKFAASASNLKTERTQAIATKYYVVAGIGVVLAVFISLVALTFQIINYNNRINNTTEINENAAAGLTITRRLDAIEQHLLLPPPPQQH